MKNWLYILAFAGIGLAVYEQSQPQPNRIVLVFAIVFFMLAIMRISSKLPSKHKDESNDDISKRG